GERDGLRAGRPWGHHGAATALLHGGRHPHHRSAAEGEDRRAGDAHRQRRRRDRQLPEVGQRLLRAGRLRGRDGGGDSQGQEEDPAVRGLSERPVRHEGPLRRRAGQARAQGRGADHRDHAHARRAGGLQQVGRRRPRAGRQAEAVGPPMAKGANRAKNAQRAKPASKTAAAATPKTVRAVPAGYHTVTAYLTVSDGARALEFYKRALGAQETERMPGPGGKIMHAEFKIGDSYVMLSDEFPGMSSCKAPTSLGGT